MHVGDRKRPPLSPREGWISDGRQVLLFRPVRYSRWSQALEVTLGELLASGEPPLLKRRTSDPICTSCSGEHSAILA